MTQVQSVEGPAGGTSPRRVAVATMIGTATEWYDYFLYGTASALVFSKLFFPNFSPAAGTLAAFATFGITFLVRPLGAAVFGHFGDRLGRKKMLVVSILLMGIGTVLIGVLPTYAAIGIWAPVLLVFLRVLQGFAVGGEYGGATVMALEYAPEGKRGLYASFPQVGNPVGLMLGTLMLYLFALLPEPAFLSWGWRIPFLFSAVLVVVGLYIRLNIAETAAFERARAAREAGTAADRGAPLATLARRYRKVMVLVILAPAALNVAFYIFSTWSISYLTKDLGVSISTALVAVMVAAALDALVQPLFGALSDRIGRRPVYIAGSVWFGLVAFPFFWMLESGSTTFIIVAMILGITIGHGATYSVQASFMSELFGTGERYSGLSIGYHVGAALLSGPGPFVAAGLLALTGSTWAISLIIVVAAVVSVIAIGAATETYRSDLDEPTPAVPGATA